MTTEFHAEPATKRMDHLEYSGHAIRRQPPFRVTYCLPPPKPNLDGTCAQGGYCDGPERLCRRCVFVYCQNHFELHSKRFSAPREGWRTLIRHLGRELDRVAPDPTYPKTRRPFQKPSMEPLLNFVVGGITIRSSPPSQIEYCQVTSTGRVDLPCCQHAATCCGEPQICHVCVYSYCQHHYPRHVVGFAWPRNDWILIAKRVEKAKKLVATKKKRNIIFRAPKLKIEGAPA